MAARIEVSREGGNMAKISISGVSKEFPISRKEGDLVLKDVSLDVAQGEFVSIVGPGGNGKSVLLRLLSGLEPPSSGTIKLDGEPITGPSPKRGIIFQDSLLYPWMKVIDNVTFGPLSLKKSPEEAREVSLRWLTLLGLKKFQNKLPHELSGGMQSRVSIARVMVNDPDVLLCDEPFGALDWITRETVAEEFLKIWFETKKTILYVTHALEEAVYLSQKVHVMSSKPGTFVQTIPIDLPAKRWEEKELHFREDYAKCVERVRSVYREQSAGGKKKVGGR
jgi:NitT/TauT family transport system ATP-binding protein